MSDSIFSRVWVACFSVVYLLLPYTSGGECGPLSAVEAAVFVMYLPGVFQEMGYLPKGGELDGRGLCPFDPNHNSTVTFVGKWAYMSR